MDEMLAHVARYLNPSPGMPATACLWKLCDDLQEVYGLATRADWRLQQRQQDISTFRFGEVGKDRFAVQLALFCTGVGFLTVNAQPLPGEVGDWLNFVHYFRFLRGQRGTSVWAQRRTGVHPETKQPQVTPFFPAPAGGPAPDTETPRTFGAVLEALLHTAALAGESTPWWREVFIPGQLLPFAGLYVDDISAEESPTLLYKRIGKIKPIFLSVRRVVGES